jgi:2-phospho-L-lactate guanylyltransferase
VPPLPAPLWTLVVPVKPARVGKSRLGADVAVVRAIALDTIAAAAQASRVARVIVVTGDAELVGALADAGVSVDVVDDEPPRGLSGAIRAGLDRATASQPRAVLLGDLPALRAAELDDALAAAAGHARAFVPDAEETGSSLATAMGGVELVEAFGSDSAARHRALGLEELQVPPESGLRRDVDTPDQLRDVSDRGVGPFTRAALASAPQVGG